MSNDFLRLLMMGTPSDELQAFLMHELTDKVSMSCVARLCCQHKFRCHTLQGADSHAL